MQRERTAPQDAVSRVIHGPGPGVQDSPDPSLAFPTGISVLNNTHSQPPRNWRIMDP